MDPFGGRLSRLSWETWFPVGHTVRLDGSMGPPKNFRRISLSCKDLRFSFEEFLAAGPVWHGACYTAR